MRKFAMSILLLVSCLESNAQIQNRDSATTALKNLYQTKFENKLLLQQTQKYFEGRVKADSNDKEAYCTLYKLYLQLSLTMYKQITDTTAIGIEKFNKLPPDDIKIFGDSLTTIKSKASNYSEKCVGSKIEYEFE